jgi:broad specificity phosphatase PhoE
MKGVKMLPETITLFRHGESEENRIQKTGAKSYSFLSNVKGWLLKSQTEHLDYDLLLSADGIRQANIVGQYFRENRIEYEAYYCSPYLRCIQTAYELGLEKNWKIEKLLAERDWDVRWINDRTKKFRSNYIMNPYYRGVSKGEKLYSVSIRAELLLENLAKRNCKTVLLVTHNEYIFVMASVIENLPPDEYIKLYQSNELPNCAIVDYTRRNPKNPGELSDCFRWKRVRSILDQSKSWDDGEWTEFSSEKFYSDVQLREKVDNSPQKFSYKF